MSEPDCRKETNSEYQRRWRAGRKGLTWEVNVIEKRCPNCGEVKPAADFAISRTRVTGLATWCLVCQRAYSMRPKVAAARKARRDAAYVHDLDFRARATARGLKARAHKLGVEFSLSADWIADRLRAGRCELTGLPFEFTVKGRGAYSPSVDRISSAGGYVESNCRVILWALNAALGPWGEDQFLPIAEALVGAQRRRRAA